MAALLLIVSCALAIPAFVNAITRMAARPLAKLLGVEALLASRSLGASLRRTSVLVGALATAIAMMTAVGIMVGSFRQTVLLWMEDQLPADLYMRPAGSAAADRHPTISVELAEAISRLPGVAAIERLREYEISVDGLPAGLASIELNLLRSYHNVDFLSGRATNDVRRDLRGKNAVIVSEPFANKHHVRAGDSITLPLGGQRAKFRVVDVYYDYSSERGTILMDRETLLRYLPDPAPSNLAIYVASDASIADVRQEIERAAAGHRILMFTNRDLRGEALRIFDRTFAITYALEAVAVLIAVMGVAGALLALVIDQTARIGIVAISRRRVRADPQADRGGGGLAGAAGQRSRCSAGICAVADSDFRDQQAIVRLDDPISLAGGGAGGSVVVRVCRDGAGGVVSGERGGALAADRGCS